jgi:hypothetical protein
MGLNRKFWILDFWQINSGAENLLKFQIQPKSSVIGNLGGGIVTNYYRNMYLRD